jgi:hypothetical protein
MIQMRRRSAFLAWGKRASIALGEQVEIKAACWKR